VTPATLLGAAMLVALVLYALLGGADYGGGIWDLLASGPRRKEQRALVERAIGPVWEANHVWLILAVVLLFTGFPGAFASISVALFLPLTLLLMGIVLRGAAFTFRAYDYPDDPIQARWGLAFSVSSVVTPVLLGIVVGAVASGRAGPTAAAGGDAWAFATPFAFAVGLFAAGLFAFLAAVYLAVEAEGDLREDFRRRALGAGVAVFVLAAAVLALSRAAAPEVFDGLTRRGFTLPLHLGTGVAAITALLALWRGRVRLARAAAAIQVSLIVVGWGASQYPYVVPPELTLEGAAGPRATLVGVLWALGAGAVLLFPALYVLFRTFKGERPFSAVDREG
jgi:cytochrome d ubiquinol oxidase subunit II